MKNINEFVAEIENCSDAEICKIIGIEGFEVVDGNIIPIVNLIADFSEPASKDVIMYILAEWSKQYGNIEVEVVRD